MLAITPSGSCEITSRMPPSSWTWRGARVSAAAARKKSMRASRPASSLRDCLIGLPTSEVRIAARRSVSRTTSSRKRRSAASRVARGAAAHVGCAPRAARYFAATDSAVSVGSSRG
jgi:hypothetical protein